MFQQVIEALIQAEEVPASTIANPYTPTQWDLAVLRIEEMIVSQPLQKDGLRRHLSGLSDEDFLAKLPADLRDELKVLINDYDPGHWGMRDAILGASSWYRQVKNDKEYGERKYLHPAVIDHLRAVGYQEHMARKIIAVSSNRLAIHAVSWAKDALQRELETNPGRSKRGFDVFEEVRCIKAMLSCLLRGIVEEGRENHLSDDMTRHMLKLRGHKLPSEANLSRREAILGFLEAAQLSLENMPGYLWT